MQRYKSLLSELKQLQSQSRTNIFKRVEIAWVLLRGEAREEFLGSVRDEGEALQQVGALIDDVRWPLHELLAMYEWCTSQERWERTSLYQLYEEMWAEKARQKRPETPKAPRESRGWRELYEGLRKKFRDLTAERDNLARENSELKRKLAALETSGASRPVSRDSRTPAA